MPRKYTGPDKLNDLLTKEKAARKYLEGLQQVPFPLSFFRVITRIEGDPPRGIQSYDTSAMKSAFAAANYTIPPNLLDRNKLLRIFAELHYGEPSERRAAEKIEDRDKLVLNCSRIILPLSNKIQRPVTR